jgi:hypothetical protein
LASAEHLHINAVKNKVQSLELFVDLGLLGRADLASRSELLIGLKVCVILVKAYLGHRPQRI